MAKTKATLYTLVQHSGYGYGHDPEFRAGLEERGVTSAQAAKIVNQGGVVTCSYAAISDLAQSLMYPEDYDGLLPVALRSGTFLAMKIDGLRVFVPHLILKLVAK